MKKVFLTGLAAAVLLWVSCTGNNQSISHEQSADSIKKVVKSAAVNPLDSLKAWTGKYPKEAGILQNELIKTRLQRLLGDIKYERMLKDWNTETPVVVEQNVLATSGCEQHNCASNHYQLYIDLMSNNINIYHRADGKTDTYFEKGAIKLPAGLQKDFNTN